MNQDPRGPTGTRDVDVRPEGAHPAEHDVRPPYEKPSVEDLGDWGAFTRLPPPGGSGFQGN